METLNKCLQTLRSTTNDSEKLAVLLVVAKIAPSVDISPGYHDDLFNAVSAKFLIRLLSSEQRFDGVSFAQISLRVCCLFARATPRLIARNELIVGAAMKVLGTDQLAEDGWELLTILCESEEGKRALLSLNCLEKLKDTLLHHNEKILSFYRCLLKDAKHFPNDFFTYISAKFAGSQDLHRFELLHMMLNMLKAVTHLTVEWSEQHKELLRNTLRSCTQVLQSRVKSEYKRKAIEVVYCLCSIFGSCVLFKEEILSECDRVILLCTTVIYVELSLDEHTSVQSDFVTKCCDFTRHVIIDVSSDWFVQQPLGSNPDFIIKIFNSLKNIMTQIYRYLKSVRVEEMDVSICSTPIAAATLICVWVTEETENLRLDFKECIPKLFAIAEKANDVEQAPLLAALAVCVAQNLPDQKLKDIFASHVQLFIDEFVKLLHQTTFDFNAFASLVHLLHVYILTTPQLCASYMNTLPSLILERFPHLDVVPQNTKLETCIVTLSIIEFCELNDLRKEVVAQLLRVLRDTSDVSSDLLIIAIQHLIEYSRNCDVIKNSVRSNQKHLEFILHKLDDTHDVKEQLKQCLHVKGK